MIKTALFRLDIYKSEKLGSCHHISSALLFILKHTNRIESNQIESSRLESDCREASMTVNNECPYCTTSIHSEQLRKIKPDHYTFIWVCIEGAVLVAALLFALYSMSCMTLL